MLKTTGPSEYSIAAVSKLTGVSCHALRVWERRYGFPVPFRTASGHRRYAAEEVAILRELVVRAREGPGRSIGEMITEYQAGTLKLPLLVLADPSAVREDGPHSRLLDRLAVGDLFEADEIFRELCGKLDQRELIERVVEPAFVEVGERWFQGRCGVFQEHCAGEFLRRKLGEMIATARQSNPRPGRSALVGTVQGDRHEGGVLMVSLLLELAGWRAICLGSDLPVDEYQRAIDAWKPDAVALSFVLSRNIKKRLAELDGLSGPPIFVGGRGVLNHQSLIRRHGLIPLTGSAFSAVASLIETAEVQACSASDRPKD